MIVFPEADEEKPEIFFVRLRFHLVEGGGNAGDGRTKLGTQLRVKVRVRLFRHGNYVSDEPVLDLWMNVGDERGGLDGTVGMGPWGMGWDSGDGTVGMGP